jgi:hypothetical protein
VLRAIKRQSAYINNLVIREWQPSYWELSDVINSGNVEKIILTAYGI